MLLQNRFQQAVKFLLSVVSKLQPIPILNCIKVTQTKKQVTYEATNLDSYLKITLPIWSDIEGTFALDSKLISKLKEKVASKINQTKIHFGNVIVPNTDVSDFPLFPSGDSKKPVFESCGADKSEFISAGKRVSNYISTNEPSRGSLMGVCFRNGHFYGTNGNILVKQKVSLKADKGFECVIPASFFRHLSSDFIIDSTIDLRVFKQDSDTSFITANGRGFELTAKLLQGDYPAIEKVLPKQFEHSFTIGREEFLEVAKSALIYANPRRNFQAILSPDKSWKSLELKTVPAENGIVYSDTVTVRSSSKAKWDGIGVSVKYLATILSDCKGKSVEIKASKNAVHPITFQPTEDKSLYFLLMPLRRIDEEEEQAQDTKTQQVAKEETSTEVKPDDKSVEKVLQK
jgi:DNA polymerase-3 subunit beta